LLGLLRPCIHGFFMCFSFGAPQLEHFAWRHLPVYSDLHSVHTHVGMLSSFLFLLCLCANVLSCC
jgi:hypothetical protein